MELLEIRHPSLDDVSGEALETHGGAIVVEFPVRSTTSADPAATSLSVKLDRESHGRRVTRALGSSSLRLPLHHRRLRLLPWVPSLVPCYDPSAMSSFDDEVAKLFAERQNNQGSLPGGQSEEHRELQQFLSGFRRLAQSEILPIFWRVPKDPSAGVSFEVEVKDESSGPHEITLWAHHGANREISVGLTYRADFRRKQVLVLNAIHGGKPLHYNLEQLTPATLESHTLLFLRTALRGHEP
ncbi:MAG TPA: hypothetical protein VOA80_11130 [Thermoanaerobaculia bacterium]|nr:hypothetical protein [Thermoanaerobaculia bacterium]